MSAEQHWSRGAICTAAPDLWSAPSVQVRQYAAHVCLEHCPALAGCRGEAEALDADRRHHVVLGGISYGSSGTPTLIQPAARCGKCTKPCLVPHRSLYTAYMEGCRCPSTVEKMRRMWRNRAAR